LFDSSLRQVIAQHPEWKNIWYDAADGQYGRPAAFYQQLQSLNLGQVWQDVDRPVLVVYGTGDVIMSRADSDAISETVNRVHPGAARNYTVDRMNHLFTIDGKFYDPLVPEIGRHFALVSVRLTESSWRPHVSRW
jgi:pimeloyl-ACP methyl ester carboxylesterase